MVVYLSLGNGGWSVFFFIIYVAAQISDGKSEQQQQHQADLDEMRAEELWFPFTPTRRDNIWQDLGSEKGRCTYL